MPEVDPSPILTVLRVTDSPQPVICGRCGRPATRTRDLRWRSGRIERVCPMCWDITARGYGLKRDA